MYKKALQKFTGPSTCGRDNATQKKTSNLVNMCFCFQKKKKRKLVI